MVTLEVGEPLRRVLKGLAQRLALVERRSVSLESPVPGYAAADKMHRKRLGLP